MRLINSNKCMSKLICLQNIFHTSVMNDVSIFYLDGGGMSYPCKKVMGVCPRGFCPDGVLSYIPKIQLYVSVKGFSCW